MDIIDQNNNINIQYWPNGKKRNNYFKHDREYCSRYFCTCKYRQVNIPYLIKFKGHLKFN